MDGQVLVQINGVGLSRIDPLPLMGSCAKGIIGRVERLAGVVVHEHDARKRCPCRLSMEHPIADILSLLRKRTLASSVDGTCIAPSTLVARSWLARGMRPQWLCRGASLIWSGSHPVRSLVSALCRGAPSLYRLRTTTTTTTGGLVRN